MKSYLSASCWRQGGGRGWGRGTGREAVELGGALVWPDDFETYRLLSRRGEPEPSGVSPAGHKSAIVPRINQTEDGPGSVSPSPPLTPPHTHALPAAMNGLLF